jgi:hypothetical protein
MMPVRFRSFRLDEPLANVLTQFVAVFDSIGDIVLDDFFVRFGEKDEGFDRSFLMQFPTDLESVRCRRLDRVPAMRRLALDMG